MKSRHKSILEILKKSNQEVTIDEFAAQLDVSAVTVRRDLELLKKEGALIRTYGGAIIGSANIPGSAFKGRMRANLNQKREIANEAIKLINNRETIILCDGTTTYQVALRIKESPLELRVITNDLNIAIELADVSRIETIVIGGKMTTYCSIMGTLGERFIESIHDDVSSIDKVFIGADAINLQYGLTAFGIGDISMFKTIVKLTNQVVAVIDHTKFGNAKYTKLLPLEQVDIIITDSGISKDAVETYSSKGVRIIVAESG